MRSALPLSMLVAVFAVGSLEAAEPLPMYGSQTVASG